MTEQEYKEICAEVQNSGIPVPSQQKIIDVLKEKPKCEDCANIRNKAIDEFAEALKKKYPIMQNDLFVINDVLHKEINTVAERLKAGGKR